jgi:hypothetical protein
MYPEVHILAGATLLWIGVEAQATPNATMAHRILLEPSHKKGNNLSTMEILRMVIKPVQAWSDLHNFFEG